MSQNVDQHSEFELDSPEKNVVNFTMPLRLFREKRTPLSEGVHVRERERERERGQTGRPTATLRSEILLTPALRFTLLLNVSFGNSKLP